MSSSPPDFTVRVAGPEDVERAYGVVAALDEHLAVDTGLTVEDLSEMWRLLDVAWLWERDGDAAAYASSRFRGERLEGNGFVHPRFFARGSARQFSSGWRRTPASSASASSAARSSATTSGQCGSLRLTATASCGTSTV